MQTNGTTDILPLDEKQKRLCNIIMGATFVLAGLIIILASTGVINAPVTKVLAPTILFAFGGSILLSAIIAKNSLSMWIGGVLITCGIPSLISAINGMSQSVLYPIYIASPAIGCLCATFYAESKSPLLKGFLFFGIIAGLFALGACKVCRMGVVAGLLSAFGGICIIIFALSVHTKKDKDNA